MTLVARPKNLLDLQAWITNIDRAGMMEIDLKLEADQLDEMTKPLLASLKNDLAKAQDGLSESKIERLALGSQTYKDHVIAACLARAAALRARVRYESLKSGFDAQRSLLALEREKVAKGIFHQGE